MSRAKMTLVVQRRIGDRYTGHLRDKITMAETISNPLP
jgi:hypothetical protein